MNKILVTGGAGYIGSHTLVELSRNGFSPIVVDNLCNTSIQNIKGAEKIIGNKIIGITCHNSIKLAKAAIKEKASYIAFGAFFPTKTKNVNYRATTKVLNKAKKLTKTPIVAIGGINNYNYKKLLLNNANLLAISSYVWNNKKFKPLETLDNLK